MGLLNHVVVIILVGTELKECMFSFYEKGDFAAPDYTPESPLDARSKDRRVANAIDVTEWSNPRTSRSYTALAP